MPDLNPVLASGGLSNQPALTIANDVMIAMLSPNFNWKWNRMKLPVVYTNSWQQDYAVPGLVQLAWLEHGVLIDINNSTSPKPIHTIETNKDLEMTSVQYGRPGQVAWLPNDQLVYGTWAANTTFGQLLNVPSCPANPLMQIQDPNGNFWVVTNNLNASVTTGSVQPTWPTAPVYPTPTSPNTVATTVADGTVTWTAVNPKGQGLRVNPIPPQTGVVFQIDLAGQKRPIGFTSLAQTLEPIPDDFASYFRNGFIAHTYMHSKEAQVRGKFQDLYNIWLTGLQKAVTKGDRERDNTGLYPSDAPMADYYTQYIGPANPYFPAG